MENLLRKHKIGKAQYSQVVARGLVSLLYPQIAYAKKRVIAWSRELVAMRTASSRLILLGLAGTATGGRESHEDLERVIAVEQLARNNQELRSREEGVVFHTSSTEDRSAIVC